MREPDRSVSAVRAETPAGSRTVDLWRTGGAGALAGAADANSGKSPTSEVPSSSAPYVAPSLLLDSITALLRRPLSPCSLSLCLPAAALPIEPRTRNVVDRVGELTVEGTDESYVSVLSPALLPAVKRGSGRWWEARPTSRRNGRATPPHYLSST